MALGNYKVPTPIEDEDVWGRFKNFYFTKKRILYIVVAILISVFACTHLCKYGTFFIFVAIVISMISLMLSLLMGFFVIPPGKYYLFGSGVGLDTLIIRVLIRKSKRYIYTKNIDKDVTLNFNMDSFVEDKKEED